MITRIKIPQAFENMEEATIGEWLVEVGQRIEKDQSLCELITEKTTFQFPSSVEGTLRVIVLPAKSIAAVGEVICLIGAPEDELPELINPKSDCLESSSESTSTPSATKSNSVKTNGRIRATPAARRAARERGIALEKIADAVPDKVLTEDDVNNFKENG